MPALRVAAEAMKTRFELVLHGEDEVRLRAAGEEALAEIVRLEAQLSFYRPSSEVGRINAGASERPVRVDPRVFRLLQRAKQLSEATGGAFDPTVGPLMRAWGFTGGSGRLPNSDALAEARSRTGMHLVELDEAAFTVRYARSGVLVDLGAIGKGYAIEEAAAILRELGVTSAFLHGGTSTAYAIGRPLDADAWRVAVEGVEERASGGEEKSASEGRGRRERVEHAFSIAPARDPESGIQNPPIVSLEDEALSVSAVWGKSFTDGARAYGHVLDPRLGEPVEGAVLAALVTASATDSDALSTAALVLGRDAGKVLTGIEGVKGGLVQMPDGRSIPFGHGFHGDTGSLPPVP